MKWPTLITWSWYESDIQLIFLWKNILTYWYLKGILVYILTLLSGANRMPTLPFFERIGSNPRWRNRKEDWWENKRHCWRAVQSLGPERSFSIRTCENGKGPTRWTNTFLRLEPQTKIATCAFLVLEPKLVRGCWCWWKLFCCEVEWRHCLQSKKRS